MLPALPDSALILVEDWFGRATSVAASTRRVGNHNLTVYGSEFIDGYAETRSMDNIDQWGAYGLERIF